jgi:hypothetical protein
LFVDKWSRSALALSFLLTGVLALFLHQRIDVISPYLFPFYVWLLTWIPGAIGLIFARLEGFKIPVFRLPNKLFVGASLSALFIALVVCYLRCEDDAAFRHPNLTVNLILYPLIGLTLSMQAALGESIFWWGYLYAKWGGMRPLRGLLIIGVSWGLWQAPLILTAGYNYYDHRLVGTWMMPLYTMILAPLMLFLRKRGQCVMVPAAFYGTLNLAATMPSQVRDNAHDLVDGPMGIIGMMVLLLCACVALVYLYQQSSLKTLGDPAPFRPFWDLFRPRD